jgi:C-terminal processing protease CtpA/Prc
LHYDGPLAVVVDARSFSSADFTPMWVQATGRGVLVGAPTGGGFGNGSTGAGLPAGYLVGVNDILCEDLDGNLLEGSPPAVDVALTLAREDVRAGVDTLLEAAAAAVLPD